MGMYLGATRLTADQARALLKDPGSYSDLMEEAHPHFDVDKAWGGLDHLLTKVLGDAGGFLLAGGERIGEFEEFDYGPPRLFAADDVAGMADLLEEVSAESLRAAYDPRDMAGQGVYPAAVWERDAEEGMAWLLTTFEALRAFVRGTANEGGALVFELG